MCAVKIWARLTVPYAVRSDDGHYDPDIYAVDLDTTTCTSDQITYNQCADAKVIGTQAPVAANDGDGNVVFGNDLGIFSEPISYTGPQSTDASEQGLLDGTRYTSGLPSFDIPVGAPGPAVPEPEAWVLMLTGLGLVGSRLRRRGGHRRARRSEL